MIIILGQGKWGARLKKEFAPKFKIKTWNHPEDPFEIKEADKIIVAIPGQYLRETLELFDEVDPDITVHSATKGLDSKGHLPTQAIRDIWGSKYISVLGGACISTEEKLDISYGYNELEWVGVLKNVYAIGYSIEKHTNGDNMAAVYFADAWEELKGITSINRHMADLAVTCLSNKSRNFKAGQLIASGEKPEFQDGQIAEGVHTAIQIRRHEYHWMLGYPVLKNVVELIYKAAIK